MLVATRWRVFESLVFWFLSAIFVRALSVRLMNVPDLMVNGARDRDRARSGELGWQWISRCKSSLAR